MMLKKVNKVNDGNRISRTMEVFSDTRLKTSDFTLYVTLKILAVDGKVEGLSHRSLGEYAHMNFQTVKASMNRLKTLGYIDSVREGVGQNTYTYEILK